MTHIEITKALNSLKAGAEWTLIGDDYADLIWLSSGKPPTLAEIKAEIAALPARESAALATQELQKRELLTKLGITADEAKLLLS
jgi:hypothetical protein